ncbi:MAG: DUF4112 domain-containing protein [Thermoanaerobaculia bacterium]
MPERVIIPEIVEDDARLPADLVLLRQFAVLMDAAVQIPGTRKRIGIDAAIGFVPGIGDAVAALMSTWILFSAVRHRIPGKIIFRMLWNVVIDLTIGVVPIAGDVFDIFFKENLKNVDLLIANRDRRRAPMAPVEIGLLVFAIIAILTIISLLMIVAMFGGILWLLREVPL